MCHLSTEFCESRLSIFLRNPANKQTIRLTNDDENITLVQINSLILWDQQLYEVQKCWLVRFGVCC